LLSLSLERLGSLRAIIKLKHLKEKIIMWKWYKNGVKYLQSYDVDSACLGCLLFGVLIALGFYDFLRSVNPLWFYILGTGFLSAPLYKFTKRSKLAFEPEVIVKRVEVSAKKAPAKKKTTVKKATTKKATATKKAPAKKPVAKKAPAKKSTAKKTTKK